MEERIMLSSVKDVAGRRHLIPLASCATGAKIIRNKNTKDLRIVNDGSHLLCLDDDAMHRMMP